MLDVQKLILSVMKKQICSATPEENQAARSVLSELKTKQIDLRAKGEITAVEQNKLLLKMKADRENSAKIYTEAGRADLAAPEMLQAEAVGFFIAMLEPELPKMLSEEEVRTEVTRFLAENAGANMGVIMKAFKDNPNIERKMLSVIVGELLK